MNLLRQRLARAFRHRHAIGVHRLGAARARWTLELRTPLPQTGRVTQLARALERAGQDHIARAARAVDRLRGALELLNPGAVLERGYAIVTGPDGAIIADVRQIGIGDDVALAFASGSATATVKSTQTADQALQTPSEERRERPGRS